MTSLHYQFHKWNSGDSETGHGQCADRFHDAFWNGSSRTDDLQHNIAYARSFFVQVEAKVPASGILDPLQTRTIHDARVRHGAALPAFSICYDGKVARRPFADPCPEGNLVQNRTVVKRNYARRLHEVVRQKILRRLCQIALTRARCDRQRAIFSPGSDPTIGLFASLWPMLTRVDSFGAFFIPESPPCLMHGRYLSRLRSAEWGKFGNLGSRAKIISLAASPSDSRTAPSLASESRRQSFSRSAP